MENQPLVTVYIPTFNRVELLKRAVKSVQSQTYKNLEIIIVDDCSTDGTQLYLEQLAKEDIRVRYFLKENNSGACVSRNIAIENAKGQFITGLDDDDYFLERRIEDFLNRFVTLNKSNIALYSLYSYKINKNKIITPKMAFLIRKSCCTQEDILINNYIGNQIFIETHVLKNNGLFDVKLKSWQDFELWYRLLGNMEFFLVRDATYIVDISHPFERISGKKIQNIKISFQYFKNKHNLKGEKENLLYDHLYNYDLDLLKFKRLIYRLFYYRDLRLLKRFFIFKLNNIKRSFL
ncbi:glycosyltransferase [Acinetobacter sp. YH16057]|uniref:glycosyltransferase n=1 Tax=Acinetobacter sp. YH16057 TaxID=2601195 RepID=UPI0015D39037|nr:glycosyltransferase [Acinetobacter sp. YH16057]